MQAVEKDNGSNGTLWAGAGFGCYVLSTGPVVAVVSRAGYPSSAVRAVEIVYMPLIYLSELVPGISDFFEWYCALFT